MRISDWSSDVCSSDLDVARAQVGDAEQRVAGYSVGKLRLHALRDRQSQVGPLLLHPRGEELGIGGVAIRLQRDCPLQGLGGALGIVHPLARNTKAFRSEEHTSELQSLMRISYAVFCLKKKKQQKYKIYTSTHMTTRDHQI